MSTIQPKEIVCQILTDIRNKANFCFGHAMTGEMTNRKLDAIKETMALIKEMATGLENLYIDEVQ